MSATVTGSEIVRVLAGYLWDHPEETDGLAPLYEATLDHIRDGGCPHRERCPHVLAGAVLVNERHEVLLLRREGVWGLPEGPPLPGDHTLDHTALRVLRDTTALHHAWGDPAPFHIDLGESLIRSRVGFRFLFHTHTTALLSVLTRHGLAQWVPPHTLGTPLAGRIQARLVRRA
ncbi:NUDIX domain-containing protein [Streptomyces sp. NPDC057638]|uniref:NUDIX domain-containing protein n=1 Tax=Streptomyces sp. NPDC057638 TaxID=3346190 RepID=UPI0036C2799E